MKKKIVKSVFLLLICVTAILFIVAAVRSYHYDMDTDNGVDILEGFEALMLILVGGLVILCEIDIFFTVYYFVVKPKTAAKTIFVIFSQLMLLLVVASRDLAHLLFLHVSEIFGEEGLVIIPIFVIYIILRIACYITCFSENN